MTSREEALQKLKQIRLKGRFTRQEDLPSQQKHSSERKEISEPKVSPTQVSGGVKPSPKKTRRQDHLSGMLHEVSVSIFEREEAKRKASIRVVGRDEDEIFNDNLAKHSYEEEEEEDSEE